MYHEEAFDRLVDSVLKILRPGSGLRFGLSSGTKTLHSMLDQFSERWPDLSPGAAFNPVGLVAAQKIDVASLRLPAAAGMLDTDRLLPPKEARQFVDTDGRVLW